MKAGKRLGTAFGVAALAFATVPARAQETPPPPADPPAETIGPRELENFSINGTVTREAEPPPAQRPATVPRPRAPSAPETEKRASPGPAVDLSARSGGTRNSSPVASTRTADVPIAAPRPQPSPSVTMPLPPLDGRVSAPSPELAAPPNSEGTRAPGQRFTAWPWLLALLAVVLGGLFLWRSRSRPSFAGGPATDAFVAPQQPQPLQPRAARPAPAPVSAPPPPPPMPLGVVSTRLRPRLELQFNPLNCVVDGDQVIVDFELELFNAGSAPARAVLIEAGLFNAGQLQDQAIGAFFDNPVGKGERIAAIAPLKRFAVRSQVVAPRANVQLFKVEGREVFVPLVAFNALYRWTSGEGQSSSAYLVGRDNKSDKLAPLRADLGPRRYGDLAARALPNAVRA